MQPSERLEIFLSKMGWSYDHFAKKIGIALSGSDKYLGPGKKSTYSSKILPLLSKANLNYNWYLTGEGEMLRENNKEQVQSNADFTEVSGTVRLPIINELSKEEKIKAREILKEYLNKLNDSLVDELI
ncbi:MAG: hypothetical protein KIT33_15965 [Candidatus Kapabacteria bacterium]|nr:hypothetical protein [Ignavibacteriota bacterium]MCW5886468.1 hypothetical protein [Candidatus Kapabacteria bacterium]